MSKDGLSVPQSSAGDWIHGTIKGAFGAIPVAGGVAAEFFGLAVAPPLARRSKQWMEEVAARVLDLEKKGFLTLTDLKQNEQYLDALLHATQVAMRTHSDPKRKALQNAVANTAVRKAPDEAAQSMFLNFIDRFNDWHIQILEFFQEPTEWSRRNNVEFLGQMMGSPISLVEQGFPELGRNKEFFRQIWRELHASGLVNTESLNSTMTWTGMISKRTTLFGDSFLTYIAD